MKGLFLLSEGQMRRIEPHFPLSHGVPRVADQRVLSGIVHATHNGQQWKMLRQATGRTRCSTTASSVGAGWGGFNRIVDYHGG